MKRILFFLLILLFPILNANANYCKYSEIAHYKALAANINTSYEYVEKNNKISFTVTINNLNKELYLVDTTNDKIYKNKDEIVITEYKPGASIKYNVYSTNSRCSDELLFVIRINLPSYNEFYNDDVCIDAESYILCQKWYSHNYNHDEFIKKVSDYKRSLVDEISEETIVVNESNFWLDLLKILLEYYYVILIILILLCSLMIFAINKKAKIYS